jgi:hypothetical protein
MTDWKAKYEELAKASKELVDVMETCHICGGNVLVDDGPVHCEDCSYDCENHDEPECTSIYDLHRKLKDLLIRAKEPPCQS